VAINGGCAKSRSKAINLLANFEFIQNRNLERD